MSAGWKLKEPRRPGNDEKELTPFSLVKQRFRKRSHILILKEGEFGSSSLVHTKMPIPSAQMETAKIPLVEFHRRRRMIGGHPSAFLSSLFLLLLQGSVNSTTTFKIVNKCRHTIWPGLLSGANSPPLPTTGFPLPSGRSLSFSAPTSWSGRIWARTLCSSDPSSLFFSCLTADCGSGSVQCSGSGAKPPATLAEFTLNGDSGLDFYDVSLVDGYNLPVLVVARNGRRGSCSPTGCLVDLNGACPRDLSVARGNGTEKGQKLACRSACEAFGDPQYCCSGAYSTPDTCPPSVYSQFFKNACPRAYSYAYDDKTSTYTCAGANYVIIFCPLPYTSQKVLSARKDPAPLPLVNKTMMYISSKHAHGAASAGR